MLIRFDFHKKKKNVNKINLYLDYPWEKKIRKNVQLDKTIKLKRLYPVVAFQACGRYMDFIESYWIVNHAYRSYIWCKMKTHVSNPILWSSRIKEISPLEVVIFLNFLLPLNVYESSNPPQEALLPVPMICYCSRRSLSDVRPTDNNKEKIKISNYLQMALQMVQCQAFHPHQPQHRLGSCFWKGENFRQQINICILTSKKKAEN